MNTSDIIALAAFVIAFLSFGVVFKEYIWKAEDRKKERDGEIKNWIIEGLNQQLKNCILQQKIESNGLHRADETMKNKQKEQAEEIKDMKLEIRTLSEAIIELTLKIEMLTEAITKNNK